MFFGFGISLFLLWQTILNPEPIKILLFTTSWKVLPVVELSISRLSAVMMAVVSGYGTLLYRYSTRYLQQDKRLNCFQTIFALKISFQMLMLGSSDLLTLFICWQLINWLLGLLSHNFAHVPTAQGAFRTFIMLRFGDLAFLLGIVLAYYLYGTIQFTQLFERAALDQTLFLLFGTGIEISGVTIVTLLIFIGAMTKSAQFPFHMWLPDALYAPTPIHALLHAGGINAGGFLLAFLAPLYILSPITLHIVLVIGLVTAILGSSMMLVQNDIKKALGYSTIGQMGYMIMECGLGAFSLAVFHLIAHGLFKADIFLNCGKGIHEARLDPNQPPQLSQESSLNMFECIGAFLLSFLIPLGITIGVHNILGISFLDSQGLLILFLFSWITVSQAMLTLFRLKKPLFTKVSMLVVITLVATAYFFAAEQFTHFLVPDSTFVAACFKAAELPYNLFWGLAALLVLLIVMSWFFLIYLQYRGKRKVLSGALQRNVYLFFMNRLYLDGIALRLFSTFKRVGKVADKSQVVFILVAALALVMASVQVKELSTVPLKTIVLLFFCGLLLPLFPLHGLYVIALTRAPRELTLVMCVLFPVLGMSGVTWFLPVIPKEFLPAISVLAIAGAFWGSVKALLQVRVTYLLSYSGLALYSLAWWHFAQTGKITPQALLFACKVTLVWCGLFLGWDRIRVRYGDLDLNKIGGLFQPMPHYTLWMVFLIMAAVGLPPFGLFFDYLGILLSPSTGISFGLIVIIATWFVSCWYMFKLMQQLLFGPYRKDISYEDLRPAETMVFVFVFALLIFFNGMSQDWLNATISTIALNIEGMTWIQ